MVNFNVMSSGMKLVNKLAVSLFKRGINFKWPVFLLVSGLFVGASGFSVQSEVLNKHEVVFIDSAVDDPLSLIKFIRPGIKIIYLQADKDGFVQIAYALSTEKQVDAIHIISHGESGELILGSSSLNLNSLAKYQTEMRIIRNALSQDADILLYGCNVAQDAKGEAFIASLASASSADVLASSNLTGSAIRGGDWVLENSTGDIETAIVLSEQAIADYTGLLAPFSDAFDTDPTGGGIVTSFSRTLDSVQFDFTFTADGEAGDFTYETANGDVNSASINSLSSAPGAGIERIIIVRNDGQDFTFTSIFINNTAGGTIIVGGYNNNSLVGSTQTVANGASATLNFGGIGVDEVRITSDDFNNTNFDTFVGDSVPPNTSPAITIDNANLAYSENAAVTQIDSVATLTDADGDADWNGGTLVAQITANNEAADELSIADNVVGNINTSGTNLLDSVTTIGTLSASEGTVTNGTALTITFNASATNALVQQVLRAIHYRNTSDTLGTSNRTVTFTATDTNAASANDTRTIAVSALNDNPVITLLNGDSFTFTEGDAATVIDQSANATLADVDSSDFNGGNLTVTITSGEDAAEDVLSLNVGGTVALAGATAGSNVSVSATVVGTLGNDIAAGNDLVVDFNASATPANVQTLLREITYQNTDTAAPTTGIRNISTTVNDGDGGSSASADVSVTVVGQNDAPTGNVTISGSAAQNQTLSASNTLADADGLGTISYQWKRGGSNISGATATTYVLVQADVGSTITVTASYIDGGSTAESVTSSATATVVAGNSAPTISGTPVTSSGDKTAYSFTPQANDPDSGDTLTFSITNKPAWAVFSTLDGSLSGTPGVAFIGTTSNIVISVDDGNGQSASLSAFNLTIFADLDGDDIADNVDTDIDGDGMDNSFETANGLDPLDPADAALDTDGDGLTNLQEFQAGKDPATDDVAPQVTAPADITLNATGYFTAVNPGVATAVDALDGVLTPSSNISSQLRPGINTVTWSATDAAGNTGSALQSVNIVPMANISKNQNAAEGSSVNVSIILNGDALQYPVVVPYTVSGTAATDGSDHTLVNGSVSIAAPNAGELPEASVSFSIVDDGAGEGSETIVITLGTPTDAIPGSQTIHSVQVVEGNVSPFVALAATQGGSSTIQVDSAAGNVIVSANVTDPNAADIFSYDWSNTDNALIDTDSVDSSFTFDPTTLTPGFYNFNVQVSDGSESTTGVLTLNILSAVPVLDTTDSDGDGVDDISEGFTDEDNDGVADYLDAIMGANVLQEKTAVSNQFLMEVDPGLSLSLGAVALRANLGRSQVSATDIVNFSPVANPPVDTVTNVGGIFDFTVEGLLAGGQSVQIVIPQIAVIPGNPVYRKLMSTGWQDFVEDSNNSLASAAGAEGFCPPPGDTAYQPGLNEGHWCVQVTIEDGGPNDTDGLADNRVTDPGGVGTLTGTTVTLRSSGGTLNPGIFFILIVVLFIRSIKRTAEKTV